MNASIRAAVATALALAFAAPAAAATVHEGGLSGGSFSGIFSAPTVLGAGVTGVTGTGSQNTPDFFVFTGLPAGAQTVTFDFRAPEGIGNSYSAGGTIKTSETPFAWGWDGITAGVFQLELGAPTDSVALLLGDGFAGTLYVGLYFTHGSNISYSAASDAAVAVSAPSVVPLPGAGLLLLTALAGAGVAARRRRA